MKKIGKYEIIEELGKGAMGVVYKALDPLIGREVAIKVISEAVLHQPEIKERFYREARSVGQLSHENITIVHDVGEADGKPYIVMEYLAGSDLRFIINRKTSLSLAQKLDYLHQICKGLQYAHDKNTIHRDIKPENIKILLDGKVKIMDFGIAKLLSSHLTQAGTQIGTPWYMSPEQIRGAQLDPRSDIFAFGIVFFELLTYRRPFEGEATAVMYKILHEPPDRLILDETDLIDDLQEVVTKCLEKEPNQRYPDFNSILEILGQISRQSQHQESVRGLVAEGRALMNRQLFKEAVKQFDEVLRLYPNHAEVQALRAQCLEREKYFQTLKVMMGDMEGETLSHYRVGKRLGAGGMGVVYKAEDTRLRRPVALKFLPPELTRDEEAKRRFMREAQTASALDHPNICTIHEIDETEAGQLFICMAYYDGLTLKKMIADFALTIAESVEFAVQIAQGLVAAHAQNIIHRDIKPANVIVTKDRVVKILDFGLAKLAGGTRITKTSVSMGTLAYMSPEQIRDADVDHRTDIWALGVILYELLGARLPFQTEHDLTLLYAIPHKPHIPISQVNPAVPRELEGIIDLALQKQAADRYATMQEMLKALKKVQRQLGSSPSETKFAPRIEKAKPVEARTMAEPGADADSEIVSLMLKGKLYLEQKKYPEALSRFRAALEVDPNAPQAHELLSECERRQKEQEQIDHLLSAGKNYFDKGQREAALKAYQEALILNADLPEAREAIKKIEGILEQAEKVEKLISDAEFYLKKEKFERAVEIFYKVLSLDPNNKLATRGLQRAEKGLETRRRGSDRQKAIAPASEKKPISKNVWMLLAAVAVLGVAGVGGWYLLSGSKSGTPDSTSGERADLSGPATAAKEALAPLKTEAGEAGVETWAAETYRRAVETEQKGDRELAQGNYAEAKQTYEAAVDSFRAAIAVARRGVTSEMIKDLDQLKTRVANTKREMQKARLAAEKVNAETFAAAPFASAARLEREGGQNEALGSNAGLIAAHQAYVEAANGYTKAKRQVDLMIQARVEAENAKTEMERAKSQLPGRAADLQANPQFAQAEAAANNGNRQFQAADYGAARASFQQALALYQALAPEMEKAEAETARNSMLAARGKVDKDSYVEPKYRDAEKAKNDAENFYAAGNFNRAAEKYKEAEKLYVAVAREAKENLIRESAKLEATKQAVRELIARYKQRLEQVDYDGFKTLFKNFDEKSWAPFFKSIKEMKVDIDIINIAPSENTAKVDLRIGMKYYNTLYNQQVNDPAMLRSWTLEQINGAWVIVKFTQ
ncbi:protein kinase [candidate division KSB1 bacterium]|nr:protein kinase [candidate division KSB1 bacterium]